MSAEQDKPDAPILKTFSFKGEAEAIAELRARLNAIPNTKNYLEAINVLLEFWDDNEELHPTVYDMYTPDYAKAARRLKTWRANVKKKNPQADFLEHVCSEITSYLYRHRSEWQSRYQVYGPYWFALKKVLDRVGYYFGEYERPELEAVYCGRTDEETVVLAHLFSEFFQSYFFIDTKALTLSENDYEDVDLSDPDMEQWLRDF